MAIKLNDLPSVRIEIIDVSESYAGVTGTRPALVIGYADKGPVGVPVEISNTSELVAGFGKNGFAVMAAYLYLSRTGHPVIFVRSFHTDFITGVER